MTPTPLILIGQVVDLVPLTDAPAAEGTIFAMPSRRTQLTWQTIHGTEPDSVLWTLQGSNDGVVFNTLDTTSAVAGAISTINTSAKFIRVASTNSGGGEFNVVGVCKA